MKFASLQIIFHSRGSHERGKEFEITRGHPCWQMEEEENKESQEQNAFSSIPLKR